MGSEWEAAPLGLWKEMGGTNHHPPPQLPPGSHALHHLWKRVSTHEAEAGNSAFWLYKEYTRVGRSCQAAAGSTIFHSWPPGPHWPAQLLLAFLTFGSNTSPPSSLQTFIKTYWLGLLSQEPGNLGSSPVLKKASKMCPICNGLFSPQSRLQFPGRWPSAHSFCSGENPLHTLAVLLSPHILAETASRTTQKNVFTLYE